MAPHQYWPIWKLLFSKVASNSSESSNWRAGYVSEKEIAALGMSWPTSSRKKSPAAIVSNKFSMHRDSKYWVRRRVFASISSSSGRLFLAGRGWTDSFRVGQVIKHFVFILTSFNFPRFRGDILQAAKFLRSNPGILYVGEKDSAISFLSEYEIAVVVENESTGYVSEKLSDAILSGCKVAYMGGKLNKEFVEGYPVVVFTHPNHAADAVQILSEMEMPDNRNQRVVSAAKSQLEDLAIQTMALRTAKLIETHKS